MAVIFSHKKSLSKLTTVQERRMLAERRDKLMKLFWEVYTKEDIDKLIKENCYYVINGDLDFLEISIGVLYE